MDAFEQVVGMLLERDGFWVRTSYKVILKKKDKLRIGLPSCPRWEIDVLAYKPSANLVRVVECKSFLNSTGVSYDAFTGKNAKKAKRYKLFTDATLRNVVLARLKRQLRQKKNGMVLPRPRIVLCLAAGRIRKGDEARIGKYCEEKGWQLFGTEWFRAHFLKLPDTDYENDVATVAAKLAKRATSQPA